MEIYQRVGRTPRWLLDVVVCNEGLFISLYAPREETDGTIRRVSMILRDFEEYLSRKGLSYILNQTDSLSFRKRPVTRDLMASLAKNACSGCHVVHCLS